MEEITRLKAMMLAMENVGAELVKVDDDSVCYNVSKDSELANDHDTLVKCRDLWESQFGITFKYRKV